jgi:hypothetical protein
VSPHVEDMTDKQRRWWFAHLDTGDAKRQETATLDDSPPHDPLLERRRGEEKDHHQGRKDGWAFVLSNGKTSQPDKTSDDPYTQGFRKGVTEAYQWVTTLKERCEKLTQSLQNAWDTLVDSLAGLGAGIKKTPASGGGDVKYHSADELAKRLGSTRREFHRSIKEDIMKECEIEMKKIGNPKTPEIGLDGKGNVWLKNLKTGKHINTGRPLSQFREER